MAHQAVSVRRGIEGFSLVEVLVALAILGIAIAAIFDLLQVGLFSSEASAGYSVAIHHGYAKMGELLSQFPVETGVQSGTFQDGYSFETHVEEVDLGLSTTAGGGFEAAAPVSQTFLIEVIIGMPNQNRKLRLQTLRTVPYGEGGF